MSNNESDKSVDPYSSIFPFFKTLSRAGNVGNSSQRLNQAEGFGDRFSSGDEEPLRKNKSA